jgi:hypothetical protein
MNISCLRLLLFTAITSLAVILTGWIRRWFISSCVIRITSRCSVNVVAIMIIIFYPIAWVFIK